MPVPPPKDLILEFMRQALRKELNSAKNTMGSGHVWGKCSQLWFTSMLLMKDAKVEGVPQELGQTQFSNYVFSRANPLSTTMLECFNELFRHGIIIRSPGFGGAGVAPIREGEYIITDHGQRWVENTDPVPEAPSTYMECLHSLVAKPDPVIEEYLSQALTTYNAGALFASAVMVGAASEKALYLLMEAIGNSTSESNVQKQVKNLILETRSLPKMFSFIQHYIGQARKRQQPQMPWEVYEGADQHLLSLMESVRVQRNDAVHPQAACVSKNSVWLSLVAFPAALKKVTDLVEWFKQNPF